MKYRACIKVVVCHEVNGLHKGIYIACSSARNCGVQEGWS